jgi:hypothetical protein
MERDRDDEGKEDEEEEDEKQEELVDENGEEDKEEDDGKEPYMIDQGEMVNTSTDHADTMVDNQPILLPEQGQEMGEHTQQPQPLAPAQRPQSQEPRP